MAIRVTPDIACEVLQNLSHGDHVVFEAGHYTEPLTINLKNAVADSAKRAEIPKTVLEAEGEVIIGAGISADQYRVEGNERAIPDGSPDHNFPGLYPFIDEAHLTIANSCNLELHGFRFEESWPTHLYLDNVQDILVEDCTFLDGTFAIGAVGEETYGLTITKCSWRQDRVPGRIWLQIPWWRMHGAEGDGYPPVDVENDWRMFDGDFFRSLGIKGGVTLSHCSIGQAFNAFHMYNEDWVEGLSRDVNIHDCEFFEIRDNVLEAEQSCLNWWFNNNRIWNAHKPLSLEIRKGGGFFLFANRFWFDSVQGPQGYDSNRGGGMFKFAKKIPKAEMKPSYYFHNSIASRSDYARKGRMAGLNHFNNAVRFVRRGIDDDAFIEDLPEVFGNLSANPTYSSYINDRFAVDWSKYDISFRNDVVYHESWPEILQRNGYEDVVSRSPDDPRFANWLEGDFRLMSESPCLRVGMPRHLQMPAGGSWQLEGSQDIGALQGEKLTEGPPFKPIGE